MPNRTRCVNHKITFYPRYSKPFCGKGRITIIKKKGSKVRTTVSLTNVYSGIAILRFVSRLGTSRILRRGLGDLPGMRILIRSRAARIMNGKSGIANVHIGSHGARRRQIVDLSNVFMRVNLMTGDNVFHSIIRMGHPNRVIVSTRYHAGIPKVCTTKSISAIPCGRVVVTVKRNTGTTLTTFRSQVQKRVWAAKWCRKNVCSPRNGARFREIDVGSQVISVGALNCSTLLHIVLYCSIIGRCLVLGIADDPL